MTNVTLSSTTEPLMTGDAALLARRYAGALYELAETQKQLDAIASDLRFMRELCHESPEFQSILRNPRLSMQQSMALMAKIAAGAKLNALTGNFLGLLAKNQRLNMLGAIIAAFMDQLAAGRGEFTAEVTSATVLTAAQQEQLASKLQTMAGGNVHLSLRQDASLLGGLVVKMGSKLIDASIKSKLDRLERQLKSDQTVIQKGAA